MAEFDFEVITRETEESFPDYLAIIDVPVFVAEKKARALYVDFPHRAILAADTVVVLDNQIIGKPCDREDAIRILHSLSGHTHQVITGVVWFKDEKWHQLAETTEVSFYSLTTTQIEYYVDHYKPYDKAGAYAIQEWIGVIGIKEIKGCFYNVMGFPISKFLSVYGC